MSLDFYLECKCCGTPIFAQQVTHNLNTMAGACGLYGVMWHASEDEGTLGRDCIERLEKGLAELKAHPDHYRKFNPENGWGSYNGLVKAAEKILEACKRYPDYKVWCCI